jgi:hypothetical protein
MGEGSYREPSLLFYFSSPREKLGIDVNESAAAPVSLNVCF